LEKKIENTNRTAISRKAERILLMVTLVWGTTFGIMKMLLETFPPMGLLTWRFGLAAVIFLAVFHRRLAGIFARRTLLHGTLLGVLLYISYALQTLGLDKTSSSRSGFITALYVAITPLLQIALTRRLPRPHVAVGVIVVLLGLWGLTAPGGELSGLIEPWRDGGFGVGDLLTLGCAVIFAVYILVLDRVARDGAIFPLTAIQLSIVTMLSLAHTLLTEPWRSPATAISWVQFLFLAIFATVFSTYAQTRYQRDTTPTRAAAIYTMESVFAAIFAVLALNEHLGPVAIAGGALIVAGLLTIELPNRE